MVQIGRFRESQMTCAHYIAVSDAGFVCILARPPPKYKPEFSGYRFFFCLGLFQYGLLHFGQTRGSFSMSRGIQTCLHRSQVYSLMVIFRVAMSRTIYLRYIPVK